MIDFFHNRTTIIIVSIIWGIGLTFLFKKTCLNNKCTVVQVPKQFTDRGNILYSNNKCYKLTPYLSECLY